MSTSPSAELDGTAQGNGTSSELEQSSGIRSLARGLRILRCFDKENPAWNLSDLSRQMNLHRATVHRFLRTLEAEGFLAYDDRSGKYHLGSGAFQLGQVTNSNSELVRLARPHMERLARASCESVGLAAWVGDGAVFLDVALAQRPFQPMSSVGDVFYDVRNSHCKVFLAFMNNDGRSQTLARARERMAAFPAVDFDRLAAELDRTAVEGVAFDSEQATPGVSAMAAPIRDAAGQVRASISIVAPAERIGAAELETDVKLLRGAAAALSRDLGYRKEPPQCQT